MLRWMQRETYTRIVEGRAIFANVDVAVDKNVGKVCSHEARNGFCAKREKTLSSETKK